MKQHNALFLAKKVKLRFGAYEGFIGKYIKTKPRIDKHYELVEWVELFETELDSPPLVKGEEVFLHTVNQKTYVEEVIRSTDNKHVYYLGYQTEVIKDDITESSKKESEETLLKHEVEYEKRLKEFESKEKEDAKINKKKRTSLFG